MRTGRAGGIALVVAFVVPVLVACGDDGRGSSVGPPAVATFQVTEEHGETYKVELITDELVENAQKLLAGEEAPSIPLGEVIRDDPDGINDPWTWHIDPATVEFADFTTEVCDGLPSDVEADIITSPLYCPWAAKLISLEPL